MVEKAYILGISGTLRQGGNTEILMNKIMEGAKSQGAVTETIYLRNLRLRQCIACEGCRTARVCRAHKDDMQLLYPKIKAAQGLVLGSPTHNYNISARMKIFIDRLYPFYYFNPENRRNWHSLLSPGKMALVYTVCDQKSPPNIGVTVPAMRLPLEALGYQIVDELTAEGFFEAGAVLKDADILAKAYNCGAALAKKILQAD